MTVIRGLEIVRNAIVERNDGHIDYLRSVHSVSAHVECRKNYRKKFSIESYKHVV